MQANSTSAAFELYKEQSLNTLAPGEVLVKLFDELLKQCRITVISIQKGDLGAANDASVKAQAIVSTLVGSLDMRYPISKDLRDMYIFWAQQLMRGNVKKDIPVIQEIMPLVKELRDSFEQAEKISRAKQYAMGGRAAI